MLKGDIEKLNSGENVGTVAGTKVGVALFPLEGKGIVARGAPNAMSEQGSLLVVPNVYMEQIIIGPGFRVGVLDLDNSPDKNLSQLAEVKNYHVRDLIVCLLDRSRYIKLIAAIRETGARIRIIYDGDLIGII